MCNEKCVLPDRTRDNRTPRRHVLDGLKCTLSPVPQGILERHESDIHFCKIRDEVHVGFGVHVLDDGFPVFRNKIEQLVNCRGTIGPDEQEAVRNVARGERA